MSSSKRLRPVVEHAESQVSQQQQKLVRATQALHEAELQLAQLNEYRHGYRSGEAAPDAAALGSVGWRDRHAFLSRLDEAIRQQQQRVAEQRQLVEQQRRVWADSRVRAESLKKVVDKRAQREAVVARRREQAALDEANTGLAARNAGRQR
ncbi:MAG: flagellar export protein FliJ [Pseudomonadota bacterium]